MAPLQERKSEQELNMRSGGDRTRELEARGEYRIGAFPTAAAAETQLASATLEQWGQLV